MCKLTLVYNNKLKQMYRQVIMEEFGGGGHQTVAGAQIKGANIDEIEERATKPRKSILKRTGKT